MGEERLLHFPETVKVGLPRTLQGQLRIQSIEGTLYARADAAFEATRVLVQGLNSGQMYVLDLSAVNSGGGINISYGSSPVIKNVIVAGNSAEYGGGINCFQSGVNLENVLTLPSAFPV